MRFFSSGAMRNPVFSLSWRNRITVSTMKTLRSHILFLLAAAAAASSCTRSVRPVLTDVCVDTLLGDPAVRIEVSYGFRSIANHAQSAALRAIEEANIEYFFGLEDFVGSAREAADRAVREIADDFLPGELRTEAPLTAEYRIEASSDAEVLDSLLVYTIRYGSYTGGAHGIYGTAYHTYVLDSGYELTTDDLFDEAMRPRLRQRIREKLYEQYTGQEAAACDAAALDAALDSYGFFPDRIDLTENFRLSSEGIAFHYNPYDIACYATGDVVVAFHREELDALRQ